MSRHTAGPWYAIKDGAGTWNVMTLRDADPFTGNLRGRVGDPYGASICMGIGDHTETRTSGNEEANARLIAAAPELLTVAEDCRRILTWLSGQRDLNKVEIDMLARAESAIARATQPPSDDE